MLLDAKYFLLWVRYSVCNDTCSLGWGFLLPSEYLFLYRDSLVVLEWFLNLIFSMCFTCSREPA